MPKPLTLGGSQTFDCVDQKKKKKWKILTEMEIPGHLIYILKNLYAGQEKTVRNRHGTMGKKTNWERSVSRPYIVTLLI